MNTKYKTAKAFRTALEQRLISFQRKHKIDLQIIRRSVAFDQLLSRIFNHSSDIWVLKGGYSMQLRLKNSRGTKDIDLAMRESKLTSGSKEDVEQTLHAMLQEAAELDLNDCFTFIIGQPTMELTNAPYGGSRFPVEAKMDDRSFEKFSLDIGIGDVWLQPQEKLATKGWLEFAGIPVEEFPAISKEQQFSEKLHAYTLPRATENSRVKDLVDMVLLISSTTLNIAKTSDAIEATFKRRNTHQPTTDVPPPPANWKRRFQTMAKESGISSDMADGFAIVQNFVTKLMLK